MGDSERGSIAEMLAPEEQMIVLEFIRGMTSIMEAAVEKRASMGSLVKALLAYAEAWVPNIEESE